MRTRNTPCSSRLGRACDHQSSANTSLGRTPTLLAGAGRSAPCRTRMRLSRSGSGDAVVFGVTGFEGSSCSSSAGVGFGVVLPAGFASAGFGSAGFASAGLASVGDAAGCAGGFAGVGCATADIENNALDKAAARAGIDVREKPLDDDEVRIGAGACHTQGVPAVGNCSVRAGFLWVGPIRPATRGSVEPNVCERGVSCPADVVNVDPRRTSSNSSRTGDAKRL